MTIQHHGDPLIDKQDEVSYVVLDSRVQSDYIENNAFDYRIDFSTRGRNITHLGVQNIEGALLINNMNYLSGYLALRVVVQEIDLQFLMSFPQGPYLKSQTLSDLGEGYLYMDKMLVGLLQAYSNQVTEGNPNTPSTVITWEVVYEQIRDQFVITAYDPTDTDHDYDFQFIVPANRTQTFGNTFGFENAETEYYAPLDRPAIVTKPASFIYPSIYVMSDDLTRMSSGQITNNSKNNNFLCYLGMDLTLDVPKTNHLFSLSFPQNIFIHSEPDTPIGLINIYLQDQYGNRLDVCLDNNYTNLIFNEAEFELYDDVVQLSRYIGIAPTQKTSWLVITLRAINTL